MKSTCVIALNSVEEEYKRSKINGLQRFISEVGGSVYACSFVFFLFFLFLCVISFSLHLHLRPGGPGFAPAVAEKLWRAGRGYGAAAPLPFCFGAASRPGSQPSPPAVAQGRGWRIDGAVRVRCIPAASAMGASGPAGAGGCIYPPGAVPPSQANKDGPFLIFEPSQSRPKAVPSRTKGVNPDIEAGAVASAKDQGRTGAYQGREPRHPMSGEAGSANNKETNEGFYPRIGAN